MPFYVIARSLRRSNLDHTKKNKPLRKQVIICNVEIATAFEKGLAMTQKCGLYPVNGYEKIKKQVGFVCFNGLFMLLLGISLDLCVRGLVLIRIFEEIE